MNPITSGSFYGCFSPQGNHQKHNRQIKNTRKAVSVHRSMNETGYLMRLAQAKTPSQVAAVVSLAKADAKSVKQLSDNSTEIAKAKKIAKAIENQGSMKSAKLRKENQLKKEALTERACKNLKRAKETTKKLMAKRRTRKAMEHAAIANSIPLDDKKQAKHFDACVDDNTDLSFSRDQSAFAVSKAESSVGAESAACSVSVNSCVSSASGSNVDCLV